MDQINQLEHDIKINHQHLGTLLREASFDTPLLPDRVLRTARQEHVRKILSRFKPRAEYSAEGEHQPDDQALSPALGADMLKVRLLQTVVLPLIWQTRINLMLSLEEFQQEFQASAQRCVAELAHAGLDPVLLAAVVADLDPKDHYYFLKNPSPVGCDEGPAWNKADQEAEIQQRTQWITLTDRLWAKHVTTPLSAAAHVLPAPGHP